MLTFPCAKINLGLNVVSVRPDGYHDIETVFYPIPLCDALEINTMDGGFPSDRPCDLKITGNAVECDESKNLVVRAYELLAKDFNMPRVHAHLYKHIPSQAGLGGGSSDAAFMIRLLDEQFQLHISKKEMERYAAMLGADCPFFISSMPSFATGIGEILTPVDNIGSHLHGYHIVIIKPDVAISTKDAYAMIEPLQPMISCCEIIRQPIETWKELLTNDFEKPAFLLHPELEDIKKKLYAKGAVYASMSGSGSAFYGLFKGRPTDVKKDFPDMFCEVLQL